MLVRKFNSTAPKRNWDTSARFAPLPVTAMAAGFLVVVIATMSPKSVVQFAKDTNSRLQCRFSAASAEPRGARKAHKNARRNQTRQDLFATGVKLSPKKCLPHLRVGQKRLPGIGVAVLALDQDKTPICDVERLTGILFDH